MTDAEKFEAWYRSVEGGFSNDREVAWAAWSASRASKPNIDECMAEIGKWIKPGILQGNGYDSTAQRNGLVLAYNLLVQLKAAPDQALQALSDIGQEQQPEDYRGKP